MRRGSHAMSFGLGGLVVLAGLGLGLGQVGTPPPPQVENQAPANEAQAVDRDGPRPGARRLNLEELPPEILLARLEQRFEFVSKQRQQISQAITILKNGGSAEAAVAAARGAGPTEPAPKPEFRATLDGEERARIMELLAEHMPGLHDRLVELESRDPDVAGEMLARLGGHLLDAFREKMVDDELGTARLLELRASWGVLDVVHRIRQANEAGGEEAAIALKPELVEAIAFQFRAKKQLADLELDRLRDRVTALESRSERADTSSRERFEAMAERLTQRAMNRIDLGHGRPPDGARPDGERRQPRRGDGPEKNGN